MKTIEFDSKYFNIKDTLDCGQIFRYKPFNDGFLVVSCDRACYVYEKDGKCFIQSEDQDYFVHMSYFLLHIIFRLYYCSK